jgi:hypothetical protein
MELEVPYLKNIGKETLIKEISVVLNKVERHDVQNMPWPEFSYKPRVSFSIAYAENAILLKYFVQENSIRILYQMDNSPVHQDSCVEFFIAFDDDEEYYNLEFNCTGTCLFGFGKSRTARQLIRELVINKIRRLGVIESSRERERNLIDWELTLVIPLEVFIYHEITHLKDRHCKVNFYKCGDKLPEPHFLAWKSVEAASPDFHLPEFFGRMHFI